MPTPIDLLVGKYDTPSMYSWIYCSYVKFLQQI
jgi:hypothetical protein